MGDWVQPQGEGTKVVILQGVAYLAGISTATKLSLFCHLYCNYAADRSCRSR